MEDTEESCSSNNGSSKNPDIATTASTPYVSAPSSPGREPPLYSHGGFFYSAPSSPMHHMLSSASFTPLEDAGGSFEFELSGEPAPSEAMTSADELFLNGQIRPMKLSSHLQRHQDRSPLTDNVEYDAVLEDNADRKFGRGRANFPARDRRRKARSMSPLRSNTAFQWLEDFKFNDGSELTEVNEKEDKRREDDGDNDNETPSSGATSRSSSVGRSSKRWIFLKELLYRSKSEGRNSNNNNNTNSNRNLKFWSTLSFNPNSSNKNQKSVDSLTSNGAVEEAAVKSTAKKAVNGLGLNRKRVGRSASAHEVHYTRNRAQAEEMRKKTYLPYRQGLLGCLGFSSKSYGAMNGFARALNPVSSR